MAINFNFRDIHCEDDILPLLMLVRGNNMGTRSKAAVFDACLKYYLAQHPEIPKGLGEIYFRDFIEAKFDEGTLLAPVSGVAFSCLPQAVASSRGARKLLAEHLRAKSAFMGHYKEFGLEYK